MILSQLLKFTIMNLTNLMCGPTSVYLGRPPHTPPSPSCQAQQWHTWVEKMVWKNNIRRRKLMSWLVFFHPVVGRKGSLELEYKMKGFGVKQKRREKTHSARSWFSLAARPSLFARREVSLCWSCNVTWKQFLMTNFPILKEIPSLFWYMCYTWPV